MSKRIKRAEEVLRIEIAALEGLIERLGAPLEQATDMVLQALEKGRKVVVIGVGKSGVIGRKIAATLRSTGVPTVMLSAQDALHGDLGVVSDGDVLLCLSYSGETEELLNLLPFLRRSPCPLIALTGALGSTLAKNSDVILDTSVQREACPLNLAPTSSSTAMLGMGDALAMVLLEERGITEEDFARYHPGGALGRSLLTKVSDIMRSEDALAIVQPEAPISEALQKMSEAHTGASIVEGEGGDLLGIFTHGDFARAFQKKSDLANALVKDYMTSNPITVQAGALAAEAIRVLGERKIDDLVVINEFGKAVGLVDSQDFARLRLV